MHSWPPILQILSDAFTFKSIRIFLIVGTLFFFNTSITSAQEKEYQTWELTSGQTFEASFTILLGNQAFFHDKTGRIWAFLTNHLIPEQQDWVNENGERGREPIPWKSSQSPMSKALLKNAVILDESGDITAFSPGEHIEPEFYVFYVGASWCGPCRSFVKVLKIWYDDLKQHGIDNVEVFFISNDQGKRAATAYMKSHDMPWPALKWRKNYPRTIRRLERNSIPGMVITDREGNILYDAHSGKEYRGAHTVLGELKNLVIRTNLKNPFSKKLMFKQLMARYLTAGAEKTINPSPAYLFVQPQISQNWGSLDAELELTISKYGHVIGKKLLSCNRPELNTEIMDTVTNWLFFPKLEAGKPVECLVKIPLNR